MKNLIIKDKASAITYALFMSAFQAKIAELNNESWSGASDDANEGNLENLELYFKNGGQEYGPALKLKDDPNARQEWLDVVASVLNKGEIPTSAIATASRCTTYVFPKEASYEMAMPFEFNVIDDLKEASALPPKKLEANSAQMPPKPKATDKKPEDPQQEGPNATGVTTHRDITTIKADLAKAQKARQAEQDEDLIPGRQTKVDRLQAELKAAEDAAASAGPVVAYPKLQQLKEALPNFKDVIENLELLQSDGTPQEQIIAKNYLMALEATTTVEYEAAS